MNEITRILSGVEQGDQRAAEQLLPLVYDELRKLAAQKMAQESPGHTLAATALVHEAYIRLVDVNDGQPWNSRGHFFAAAAEAMRRILVENARRKGRVKYGGGYRRIDLNDTPVKSDDRADDLLALNDALTALAREDPAKADIVKLRYFAGLTLEQVAACQGISLTTAKRRWLAARAWLYDDLSSDIGQ
jgi:RNA polymerase sigma factor (TIGR02999 family)